MKRMLSSALVLTIALLGIVGSTSQAYTEGSEGRVISVIGEGKVTAVPDIAIINIGVEAEAREVAEAQETAAITMNKIIASLQKSGVTYQDIQTKHYYINPVRGKGKIIGYKAVNMASVKMRDIDKVGIIIDDAVEAGGDLTRVEGIRFDIADPAPYYEKARERAVKDAKAKAEQLARLNGIKLGRPICISEGRVSIPPHGVRGMGYAELSPPISPGEMEIAVEVSISYAVESDR